MFDSSFWYQYDFKFPLLIRLYQFHNPFRFLITFIFNSMLLMEESLRGNEKLPWDGLDQRQEHKDDEESAIMCTDAL